MIRVAERRGAALAVAGEGGPMTVREDGGSPANQAPHVPIGEERR
jgi:hypothetical protein